MLPLIAHDSIVAVFQIAEGGNKKIGWLKSDGTITDNAEEAVIFYRPETFNANARFYSNPGNVGKITWPVKPD